MLCWLVVAVTVRVGNGRQWENRASLIKGIGGCALIDFVYDHAEVTCEARSCQYISPSASLSHSPIFLNTNQPTATQPTQQWPAPSKPPASLLEVGTL